MKGHLYDADAGHMYESGYKKRTKKKRNGT